MTGSATRRLLGANLRTARFNARLTQRELGLKIGKPSGCYVSVIESGHAMPSDEMLARMATVLDTTPEALLRVADAPARATFPVSTGSDRVARTLAIDLLHAFASAQALIDAACVPQARAEALRDWATVVRRIERHMEMAGLPADDIDRACALLGGAHQPQRTQHAADQPPMTAGGRTDAPTVPAGART